MLLKKNNQLVQCAHCGIECESDPDESLSFCCNGCEQIYLLLKDNDLGQYYNIEAFPGKSAKGKTSQNFEFLDEEDTAERLIDFKDKQITKVHFSLPDIHCSSCLWLLENLPHLHQGIRQSKVNFLEKKAYITFDHHALSLRNLVELLSKIGYTPELNFAFLEKNPAAKKDQSLILKIGVAGFCFGNIMLLSFPEYLGFHEAFKSYFFGYLNIALAIPVLLYAGFDYLKDAYNDLKHGHLGIHVPLAIGMLTLFSRSLYEISFGVGEGYLDSFAGFVLFLLVGQWFQKRTQKFIEFDRDYRSYFPISVEVKDSSGWKSRTIDKIEVDDVIKVKNEEVIPCDGIILEGKANVDYSFVTGETDPQTVECGEKIFAGGKQMGAPIILRVEKRVEQGYLTQLWNESTFKKKTSSKAELLLNQISKYFTLTILLIAVVTFLYWLNKDVSTAFRSVTAVLIVACPCALALSVPFLLGSAMRLLAKMKFHVRSISTLEKLADIDTIILDKTGTITENNSIEALYSGSSLDIVNQQRIYSLCSQSSHPLSKAICKKISSEEELPISNYKEHIGLGISGECSGKKLRIGSSDFIFASQQQGDSSVFIEINGKVLGKFEFQKRVRSHIKTAIGQLSHYRLALLSGDGDKDKERMKEIFPANSVLKFHQKPTDKLRYIQDLQADGHRVMMIGDGLNDAGALKQSDVGIVVVENNNTFTPACDAIISSDSLRFFTKIQVYFTDLRKGLYGAFIIAFLYNAIGLGFAVTGNLSPLVAAILMPASSITIILYSFLVSKVLSLKISD